jgi:hypothetical protein
VQGVVHAIIRECEYLHYVDVVIVHTFVFDLLFFFLVHEEVHLGNVLPQFDPE